MVTIGNLGPSASCMTERRNQLLLVRKVFDASEEQESPTQKVGFDKKIPKGLMKENEIKRAPRQQRGVRADTTLGLCWDQLQVFADHRITFMPKT